MAIYRGSNGALWRINDPVPKPLAARIRAGSLVLVENIVLVKNDEGTSPPRPPLAGPGSSRQAWAEYAARLGVPVTVDMGRAEIVQAVDADG